MATLNVYAFTPGKPMVYSLETARRFLASTKQPLYIRAPRGYYTICGDKVTYTEPVDEWVELERWAKRGEDAVRWIYSVRKTINARFRD